ncbi:hypothetical protein ATN84_04090 [Paramesorhizobium deserti]|uniref:Uncharacterized protein n=1 Tax=Paramesorhizobium deserti TaxID=1494590 RepID=A0A135I0G2_9HYPH|nr:hypothetical protein ATN84_04090 [Paramesorhizobium deserti]
MTGCAFRAARSFGYTKARKLRLRVKMAGGQQIELPRQTIHRCEAVHIKTNHQVLQSKGFKAQTSKVMPMRARLHKAGRMGKSQMQFWEKL